MAPQSANKILEKLGKLKAMSESAKAIGNEVEAQSFAAMLQNLLAKHKLEMTDIEYTAHVKDEPVGQFMCGGGTMPKGPCDKTRVYRNYPEVEVPNKRIHWQEELGDVIARAHSCQILVSKGTGAVWFCGMQSNVKVVETLYIYMIQAADRLATKSYKQLRSQLRNKGKKDPQLLADLLKSTHGYTASFLKAFTRRLSERFEEGKRAIEADNTGTALMRIDKEAKAVQDYLDSQRDGKGASQAKRIRGQRSGNYLGEGRGRAAADSLNIDKAPSEQLEEGI